MSYDVKPQRNKKVLQDMFLYRKTKENKGSDKDWFWTGSETINNELFNCYAFSLTFSYYSKFYAA